MVLMLALCLLVVVGIVAIVRWTKFDLQVPWDKTPPEAPLSVAEAVRRYVWHLTVAVAAGVGSGIVFMGAGGRLAMRLLAITSGDAAQGRVTEADEIVGAITLEGTLGFVVFFGIFGGALFGVCYMVIRRWLPPTPWSGVVYGALLLIVFATRLDPLRAENPDFAIIKPDWLAVVVYIAIGLGYGMLTAAIAGRYSRALPPLTREPRVLVKYTPALLFAPAFPALVFSLGGGAVWVGASRTTATERALSSPRVETVGRVLLAAATLVAAYGFVGSIVDIVTV